MINNIVKLLVFFAIFTFSYSSYAENGKIFSYTTDNGTVSFTDDLSRVPTSSKEAVEEIDSASLQDKVEFTHVDTDSENTRIDSLNERLLRLTRNLNETPVENKEKDCGPIRLRTERRDVENSINKRFYIVEDDCGALFDAPFYPELNAINRK